MLIRIATSTLAACLLFPLALSGQQADVFDRVKHGYATSDGGVKIHYATLGTGPLVVMIHGFPDFWYSWRHSMAALSDTFQVVAGSYATPARRDQQFDSSFEKSQRFRIERRRLTLSTLKALRISEERQSGKYGNACK